MNAITVEILMSIFGVLTSFQIIPQCVRIHRRRKSDDLSLWTMYISIIQQVLWLGYAIWKPVICLVVTEGVWLTLLIVLLCFIFKYRGKRD